MTILLDTDVLVYYAGFAVQKTRYTLINPVGGQTTFPNADECKVFCKQEGIDYKEARLRPAGSELPWIETHLEVFEPALALKVAQQRWDDVIAACGGGRVESYLTGTGNFRDAIAVTKPYKGNRDQPKPVHYDLVREFYAGRSEIVSGMEADDAIGIRASQLGGGAIIASIDKDMNMIAGKHYDWYHGKRYIVKDDDAHLFFMAQVMAGDSTDNVVGIPGWGLKGALTELRKVNTRQARWSVVEACYAEHYEADADKLLSEMGALVWIRQLPDERWTPAYYKETYVNGR